MYYSTQSRDNGIGCWAIASALLGAAIIFTGIGVILHMVTGYVNTHQPVTASESFVWVVNQVIKTISAYLGQ